MMNSMVSPELQQLDVGELRELIRLLKGRQPSVDSVISATPLVSLFNQKNSRKERLSRQSGTPVEILSSTVIKSHALAANEKGDLLYEEGLYEDALEYYRQAQASEPENPLYGAKAATMLLWQNKMEEFANACKQLEAERLDVVKAAKKALDAGVSSHNQGHYQKAITQYSEAIKQDPSNTLAWKKRSCCYYNLENYQRSKKDAERAIGLDLDDAEGWYYTGLCDRKLGEHVEAIDALSHAIVLDPTTCSYWVERGSTYRLMNQPYAAMKDLQKAFQLKSNCDRAFAQRGLVHLALGDFDQAEKDLTYAIRLNCREDWYKKELENVKKKREQAEEEKCGEENSS
eukprot:Protomagalhaensia_wolfi_Nauph_80__1059@NODE_1616_length_1441_cov_189_405849_g1251_i0_p1_GENE_NODE_1616_length_1441_cov_189_405849_g1251_i0NODE_1616_length_1441_cov_189_405849_g1251_i0_p1_ORF_typecomplete_len344_score43_89TPR_2/PF07719_17/0_041TPR_2/PF07719_17/0_00026TPR_2/PF07719_17/0_02TPR_2/PF07719_17/6_6e06TPR_2/PF07719_17/17TPR_2/PF07719_17/0_00082TPR_16/PF13432_6/0_00032TPR_16/PF13432_6/2_1e05TPR_16/PF13432_6/1e09TPR_16/PF13432_6/2_7e05TPR_1/PF00515_28/0_056TPR_1/PF00515_28/0_0021TPR_1/PF00